MGAIEKGELLLPAQLTVRCLINATCSPQRFKNQINSPTLQTYMIDNPPCLIEEELLASMWPNLSSISYDRH